MHRLILTLSLTIPDCDIVPDPPTRHRTKWLVLGPLNLSPAQRDAYSALRVAVAIVQPFARRVRGLHFPLFISSHRHPLITKLFPNFLLDTAARGQRFSFKCISYA